MKVKFNKILSGTWILYYLGWRIFPLDSHRRFSSLFKSLANSTFMVSVQVLFFFQVLKKLMPTKKLRYSRKIVKLKDFNRNTPKG